MTGLVWTRQPLTGLRVNRANPLARGLVRLVVFHQGQPYDLITNERLTVVGTAFGPAFTPDGVGIQNTAETAYWTLPLRTESAPTSFSMGWVGQHAGGTTPITVRDATGSGGNFMFRRITGQWNMRLGGTDYTAGGTFNTGTPYRALISGAAATGKLWVNGSLVINGSTPGASGFAGPWYIHQNGTAGGGPTATTLLLAIWDRPVTDIEGQSFTANPWQLIAPRRRPVFGFTVAAGSTGTVATTNANDTSAGSGTTTITGALAKANANDAATASGSVGSAASGSVVVTNANDTSAAAGTTTVVGSLARTNSNDTSAASGTTTVTGTLARTNANDTATASGVAGAVTGTAAPTNADDTSAASGASGTAQPRAQGAGRAAKRRGLRVIEIDGKDIVVESAEEAQALLDGLKADAEKKAAVAVQRAISAPNRKPRKVVADARRFLQVPAIEAPGFEAAAAETLASIEALYRSAMVTVEVAALLAKRQREEEDDEDVLLLIA